MLSIVVELSKLVGSKSFALTVLICPDWFRSEASSVLDPDLTPAQAGAENIRSNATVAKRMRRDLIFSPPLSLLPGRITFHSSVRPPEAEVQDYLRLGPNGQLVVLTSALLLFPNRRYREGRTKRFSSVEVTRPPRMTIAIGCSIS